MVTCRHVQNQQLTHCPRSPLEGRQAADKCCESATARAAPQPPGHRAARSACAPRLRLQTPHSHPGHHQVGMSGRQLGPPSPTPSGTAGPHWRQGVISASTDPQGAVNQTALPEGKARPHRGPRGWSQLGRLTGEGSAADCAHGRLPALGLLQPRAQPREGAQGHMSDLTATWTSAVTDTDVGRSPGVSQLRTLCLHHNRGARCTWACGSGSGVT